MALDSDIANADAHLHVEFYEHEKDPYKGKAFVRIMIPGDKTSVIDTVAADHHKRRFQRQWLHFQMQNSDGQIVGTPLSVWHKERPDELTDGQLQELLILKFQSVEQLAMATDSQIQRVGMGAAGLRERARSFLSSKNAQASGAELAKAQAEIEALKAMVANIASMQAAQPLHAAAKPRGKKRGRPFKNKVPVNVQHDDAAIGAAGS